MIDRMSAVVLVLVLVGALIGEARWQRTAPAMPSAAPIASPTAPPTASPIASPITSPLASPVASPTGRSVSVAGSVTIRLHDGWFDPAYVEATNGHALTITLVNDGSRHHAFRIDRYDVDVDLAPGESRTVVIESPTLGDFTYYSDAPGDGGMIGELTFYI
jgi:plastocyanin